MGFAGYLLHLATGGIALSLGWAVAGILAACLSATRPLASACFQLSLFQLWPVGKELAHEHQIHRYQAYLRTGDRSATAVRPALPGWSSLVSMVLWAPLGVMLGTAHLLQEAAGAALGFRHPSGARRFWALRPAIYPLGWRVVRSNAARAQMLGSIAVRRGPDRQSMLSREFLAHRGRLVAKPVTTAFFSAILVLSASASADGPRSGGRPPSLPLANQNIVAASVGTGLRSFAGVRGPIKPKVPPMEVDRVAPPEPACAKGPAVTRSDRLSRAHMEVAMPLGSPALPAAFQAIHPDMVSHAEKLQDLVDSVRFKMVVGSAECKTAIFLGADRVGRLAADRAMTLRLAKKAEPRRAAAGADPGREPGDEVIYAAETRNLKNIGLMMRSLSPAKARNDDRPEAAAVRIARVGVLW